MKRSGIITTAAAVAVIAAAVCFWVFGNTKPSEKTVTETVSSEGSAADPASGSAEPSPSLAAASAADNTEWDVTEVTENEVTESADVTTEEEGSEERHMQLEISGIPVTVEWEKNSAVDALRELCSDNALEIEMSMYGGFEQVGQIGAELPREDTQITTSSGDIVLYSGDQIVVFYGSNSWSYTPLGHITDSAGYTMEQLLGSEDTQIRISLD